MLYVFDPTITDSLSRVRGVGRYVQLLREALPEATFTDSISTVPYESTFINPFFNILQPPLIRKRVAKWQIAVIHDLIPLKYPQHFPIGLKGNLNVFFNKLTLKYYDQIITDSEVSKADIIKTLGISSDRITVIYPVLPASFFNVKSVSFPRKRESRAIDLDPGSGSGMTDKYFIYVGDATWNKNLVTLAEAVIEAGVTLVCIGKVFSHLDDPSIINHPWEKDLKAFAKLVTGNPQFIFPGYITDEELTRYYKNAIANVLVSRDEGFGFSYYEASSQSTPSLLSNRPIFQETAGDTALLVDPDSVSEISRGLQTLAKDKKLRTELGKKAFERVKTFTVERFKEEWSQLLQIK